MVELAGPLSCSRKHSCRVILIQDHHLSRRLIRGAEMPVAPAFPGMSGDLSLPES